jgi:hypothetical protein
VVVRVRNRGFGLSVRGSVGAVVLAKLLEKLGKAHVRVMCTHFERGTVIHDKMPRAISCGDGLGAVTVAVEWRDWQELLVVVRRSRIGARIS